MLKTRRNTASHAEQIRNLFQCFRSQLVMRLHSAIAYTILMDSLETQHTT